jgi:NAD(P)-dependent dehydrogenase (short-subunit alcohol dehydrogenase family)
MAGRLAHKVAVITGGAKGIGQAIASRFAREGASVVVADVQEAEAGAVAQQLVGAGYAAAAVRCDVSKAADVDRMVQFAVERFGSLDIMVANAGASPPPQPPPQPPQPPQPPPPQQQQPRALSSRPPLAAAAGVAPLARPTLRPPPIPRARPAGIVRAAPFLEMSEHDFDDVLAVNLVSCTAPWGAGWPGPAQPQAPALSRERDGGCSISRCQALATGAVQDVPTEPQAGRGLAVEAAHPWAARR